MPHCRTAAAAAAACYTDTQLNKNNILFAFSDGAQGTQRERFAAAAAAQMAVAAAAAAQLAAAAAAARVCVRCIQRGALWGTYEKKKQYKLPSECIARGAVFYASVY